MGIWALEDFNKMLLFYVFFPRPAFLLLLCEFRLFGSSSLKELEELMLILLLQVHRLAFGCENLRSP